MTVKLLPGMGEETVALENLLTLEQAGFKDWEFCTRELDPDHVAHLVESEPSSWPRIETVKVHINGEVQHALVDGRHRTAAAIDQKGTTIRAHSASYANEAAVIDAAFQANLNHGLAASSTTRTTYALWLYYYDESEQPNISAIARKVGLNKSTVSRAIKRAEQEDREAREPRNDEEQSSPAEVDNTKRLASALHRFYSQERTLRGMFGDGSKPVDVNHRAKKLYKYLAALPKEKQKETATELVSLYETLHAFVNMYQETSTKTGTR